MFSRNKSDKSKTGSDVASKTKNAPPSIISVDLKTVGDLSSTGEIHIDGTIIGDIHTRSLLIGATANIKGEIIADQVRIYGRVEGQIRARQVTLAKSAHVTGDILHEDLTIETGAFLEGLCKHEAVVKVDDTGQVSLVKGAAKIVAPVAVKEPGNATETPVISDGAKKAVG